MFGLFKKKTELEKLQDKYEKLMKQSFELSTKDRRASDAKAVEANLLLKKMEGLV